MAIVFGPTSISLSDLLSVVASRSSRVLPCYLEWVQKQLGAAFVQRYIVNLGTQV